MSHYRIYLLDSGGRIATAHDADCVKDDEACASAAQLAIAGQWAELWHGTRCVGQVRSGDAALWSRGTRHPPGQVVQHTGCIATQLAAQP